jgi:hypothetical protein
MIDFISLIPINKKIMKNSDPRNAILDFLKKIMGNSDPRNAISNFLKKTMDSELDPKLHSGKKDNTLQLLEDKYEWIKRLKDLKFRYNRVLKLIDEVTPVMEKKVKEWNLYSYDKSTDTFYDMEEMDFYDSLENHKISDIEHFKKGFSKKHYKWAFQQYENYLLFISKLYEERENLEFMLEEDKEDEEDKKDNTEYDIQYQNLRYQLLLFYELGIIDHLKKEIKERGIKLEHQNRSYLPRILGHLMNESNPNKTLRKELNNLATGNKKDPINNNSKRKIKKILANFDLKTNRLE